MDTTTGTDGAIGRLQSAYRRWAEGTRTWQVGGLAALAAILGARLVNAYNWFWGARTKAPWLEPPFGWLGSWLETEIMHNPIPGYPWLIEHLLLPNLTLLGWASFIVESYLAIVLLLGFATRFNGWIATLWGLNIAIGNIGAPREVIWALFPLFLLPLIAAEARAGRIFGLDGVLRDRWLESDNRLLAFVARHGM